MFEVKVCLEQKIGLQYDKTMNSPKRKIGSSPASAKLPNITQIDYLTYLGIAGKESILAMPAMHQTKTEKLLHDGSKQAK